MAKELSIFVDESSDRGGKARYYLLALVYRRSQLNDLVRLIERMGAISPPPSNSPWSSSMAGEGGETYGKFFGGVGPFKRNWLKQARSKQL